MRDLFDFDAPVKKFAVMGNPVAHSKSPRIHATFAKQCGIRLQYTAIQVDPGGFAKAVDQFRANGGAGLNVTVPFKLEAFKLAERLSERARMAGAVNTLKFEGAIAVGDNTDGVGLVRDLENNLQVALAHKRVLVVGAGGAVRGILAPLHAAQPAQLIIANRTIDKARDLLAPFVADPHVRACGLHELAQRQFDVVINGTAASLQGEVPPLPQGLFAPQALAYDLMYADTDTPFMAWARAQGAARVADGLGMLVEQAAESFFIWLGVRPRTREVIDALRARL